jgi:hypothetical protein
VRRLIAEMIPTGSPASSQKTTAPNVSEIVAGSRERISFRTGCESWKL